MKFTVSQFDLTKLSVLFESCDGSINLVPLKYRGHIPPNLRTATGFESKSKELVVPE